jgi:serine protease AprX
MKKLVSMLSSFVLVLSLFSTMFMTSNAHAGVDLIENKQGTTTIGPNLLKSMKLDDGSLSHEVIVTFYGNEGLSESEFNILDSVGITKAVGLQSLPMAGVLATSAQINELAQMPEVRSIYENSKLEYENYDSTSLTGVKKVLTDDSFRKANGGLPVSGKGITVLVNDSGIDATHKDLEYGSKVIQNVLGSTNLNSLVSGLLPITYTEDVPNTDSAGHGTHVAGTVGGYGVMSAGKYEGAAPGVNIVGYGSGAGLFILDTLGGFDYALTHQYKYDIRVITNSFGSTNDVGSAFDPEHPTNIATKKLYDRGIVVVFSAGNSGPAESTITGNFKKAPWVITVAAGDKYGNLAEFSSRGVKGKGGEVEVDGKVYQWEDRPTVTAPGVDVISTRAWDALAPLGIEGDMEQMDPAHVPYYTSNSGTSMAAPHIAGIVALILDANPLLSPDEVKEILQMTATNIPGKESWEVGAGYANAYAAVDYALNNEHTYGKTLNKNRTFNSTVNVDVNRSDIEIDFSPVVTSSKKVAIDEGLTELAVTVYGKGFAETGNPINLVLIAPDGTEYSSGISLLFSLYYDRTVIVNSPMAGEWTIEIRGLRGSADNPTNGNALPEKVQGQLTTKKENGYSGMTDIEGHLAKDAILMAVHHNLIDGYANSTFKPDKKLSRIELAEYLVMGAATRQNWMNAGNFSDISAEMLPYVHAVTARGAALKDRELKYDGVMLSNGSDFNPNGIVSRAELAYSLIQSLGLQEEAKNHSLSDVDVQNGARITVQYKDERIAIEDTIDVPEHLRGYVQLALDLNVMNAKFALKSCEYCIEPTLVANFTPAQEITRAEYAVMINRFYSTYLK